MKYKVGYIIFVFLLSVSTASYAQMQFNFNGLGRSIVTSNKMDGDLLKGDTLTPSKGVSGYTLFDLQPNIIVGNTVKVNSILRLRNPFGSFYGQNTTFAFRQFQVTGRIGKTIEYELGDIYLGEMTRYTMFKPYETDHEYESEIHAIRRSVAEYENFVKGNMWRLQGVQGKSLFGFNKGIKTLGVNIFGVRTNATNDKDVADRILAGGRINAVQSNFLSLGVNYVGLMDIKINTDAVEYSNRVITGDAKVTIDKDAVLVQLNGEFGGSSFKNVQVFGDSTVKYSDYIFEGGAKAVIKSAKLKVFASYRSVGAQFSSPSAQTARLNINQMPSLFGGINQNTSVRSANLNDRLIDEQLYNRSVSAVLYSYNPLYGNLTPYGDATPNRAGMTFGLGTDTSAKIIKAEVSANLYSEIIGEGVIDKRKFTSIKGGLVFNFGDLLKLNRKMSINLSARQEMTKRGGDAPTDFKTLLIDAGGSFEVFKKLDALVGIKMLNGKGNEYYSVRNQFNLLSDFAEFDMDIKQSIYSFGLRVRFGERSYFTGNYNVNGFKVKNYSDSIIGSTPYSNTGYNINQLFFNYTLIF